MTSEEEASSRTISLYSHRAHIRLEQIQEATRFDNGGFVSIGIGICAGAAECLGPVSGETLDMLGVKPVAERMADHVVSHHPTMPGAGKTAQAVASTRRLEDSLHASIVTIVPCLCKTMAAVLRGQ